MLTLRGGLWFLITKILTMLLLNNEYGNKLIKYDFQRKEIHTEFPFHAIILIFLHLFGELLLITCSIPYLNYVTCTMLSDYPHTTCLQWKGLHLAQIPESQCSLLDHFYLPVCSSSQCKLQRKNESVDSSLLLYHWIAKFWIVTDFQAAA